MSQTLDQIYIANPITTNLSTDLMYFSRSPYTTGNDAGMLFSNFSTQFASSSLTSGHIFVGNGINVASSVALSGDATLSNTGALTLGTVNTNVGTFQGITVNAKGLVTAAVNQNYISGNQTITLSGDTTGSGTTAITTTLATVNSNIGTFQGLTINAKGLVTAATNQNYLTANQTITFSGDATGNGSTAVTLTLANVNSNVGTFNGITVNAKGLVTAAASVSPGTSSINQTSSTATLAASTRYVTNNGATLVTYSLPTSAAVGDTYTIIGASAGGWTVVENSGQTINYGTQTTTTTTGSLSSSNQHDKITITCTTANTTFSAYDPLGAITVV